MILPPRRTIITIVIVVTVASVVWAAAYEATSATASTATSTFGSPVVPSSSLVSSSPSSSSMSVPTSTTTTDASSSSTTSSTTASSSMTITANSTDGLALQMRFSPSSTPSVGQEVKITAVLENNNQTTTISSINGNITITAQNGSVVYSSSLVPFQAGSLKLTSGQQISFQFLWNTSENYSGVLSEPGVYNVKVIVQFTAMQPQFSYIVDITELTLSSPSS